MNTIDRRSPEGSKHVSDGPRRSLISSETEDSSIRAELRRQNSMGVVEAQRYCVETAQLAIEDAERWAIRVAAAHLGDDIVLLQRLLEDGKQAGVIMSKLGEA